MADQFELIGPRGGLTPRRRPAATGGPGRRVRVVVDSPLPQLDRLFDFAVPRRLDVSVQPGVRVRVAIAGRRHDGFVVADGGDPQYTGPVRPLDAVVSPVPVLSAPVLTLCRAVAEHYAGGLSDVVRLAVPPRVARAEAGWAAAADGSTWSDRPAADHPDAAWAAAAAAGREARAVWTCPPGVDWAAALAGAARTVAAAGRGAVLVLPDGRDVNRVAACLTAVPEGAVAVLRAEDGAEARYRSFLAALSGRARIVVGTRAAAFAPVADIGLVAIWDDGDPTHADLHAPYPHAREVLALRSHLERTALLIASHSRTCEAQRLVVRGWAADISDRAELRRRRPRVSSAEDRVHSPFDLVRRFPAAATAVLREGLRTGPVLIQTARAGYVPACACDSCRQPARCSSCGGPWEMPDEGAPRCGRCGKGGAFHCPHCGGTRLRAAATGAGRTAEEAARMFPGHPVVAVTADSRLHDPPTTGVVVATPGMEPVAPAGYSAAYLPDAHRDLWHPDVRAAEQALRRWCNAAALVRPGAAVLVNADPGEEAVQALIRWDAAGFAARELRRREEESMPPAVRLVQVDAGSGDADRVVAAVTAAVPHVRVLGPRPTGPDTVRVLLTAPDAAALVAQARRAVVAAAGGSPVRVQVDPVELH